MIRSFFLFVLTILSSQRTSAQNIYVHTTDGATHSFALVDVSSITFNENVMNVNLVSLDTVGWNISTVKYYEYDQWYLSVADGLALEEKGIKVFPNPGTEYVNIQYTLSEKATVIASIYNLQGQLVEKLFEGSHHKGCQLLQWRLDPHSGLANGAYLCKVQVGQAIFNKLVVIKH